MWDIEVDLVSAGTSCGGLVGAITGHDQGLSSIVVEKADNFGGGAALSGGVIWIPNNHHMGKKGLEDSREDALTHLRHIGVGRHDEERTVAFVDKGPEMLRYIEENTPLKMTILPGYPDYRAELPGGRLAGRYLLPSPLPMAMTLAEAERQYPVLDKVRKPPVSLQLGMPDQLWAGGRTLIGPLVLACFNRGIDIKRNARARQLIVEDGRVMGLKVEHEGKDLFIKANKGVLLATGGFEWNAEMNKRFIEGDIHPFTNPQNEGDGHIMGMEIGAAVALMDHTVRLPTIRIPGEEIDGKPLYRLFLASCGKPGDIIVNQNGKRCCNESFYIDMGRAFTARNSSSLELTNRPMYWIADQSHRDKYFCGPLSPGKSSDGCEWIESAKTLKGLAEKLNIDSDQLEKTVEKFNGFAREGKDPDFNRGETAYDRIAGDPNHEPHPSLGPLTKPPFYGIEIYPGTAGNQGGLVANKNAQIIDTRGEVIPGLYGTSNATAHLAMGSGYNSGFFNGRSMVFGYVAAKHMSEK
ncbi:MAG: FAD-binding protein [Desulfobacterales bacterium]|nr:FAD-binding protein [Desulfobacteraceae bacterium]MBT4363321.1 FAD-binding protein [Desulfobacteraceae bacterium]MBT7086700.1 FAD-binding protein [Desulfobacterales bacterium]